MVLIKRPCIITNMTYVLPQTVTILVYLYHSSVITYFTTVVIRKLICSLFQTASISSLIFNTIGSDCGLEINLSLVNHAHLPDLISCLLSFENQTKCIKY